MIRPADNVEMVFVPAGEFLMGSTDADPKAGADEMPAHMVHLDAFWIDMTEVTNAQYVRFLGVLGAYRSACGEQDCIETKREDADSHITFQDGRFVVEGSFENRPVIEVTWFGAQAYCQWAGARLPTEAEWEKAAFDAVSPCLQGARPAPHAEARGPTSTRTRKDAGTPS